MIFAECEGKAFIMANKTVKITKTEYEKYKKFFKGVPEIDKW